MRVLMYIHKHLYISMNFYPSRLFMVFHVTYNIGIPSKLDAQKPSNVISYKCQHDTISGDALCIMFKNHVRS